MTVQEPLPIADFTLYNDGISYTEQHASTRGMGAMSAREGGLASGPGAPGTARVADRGLYHAADAMRAMYDMGDAPSCLTCGAIMVRSGSCYRCMSCGSTSGCS